MTERQLECFLSLAKTLNFSQTAQQMYLTQPAVSQQIRALESDLGVPLFTRGRGGVALTPAGVTFCTEAADFLAHSRSVVSRVRSSAAAYTTLRDISVDELAAARSHLGWREYRRALHVVGENARVLAGVRDLEEEDVLGFGHLWFESHESSRMNFENSTPELDYLVELAKSTPGCYGARLSGGGFGGITIHLVASDQAEEYAKRICTAYRLRTHITPHYFICPAGDGAKVWTL